MPLAATVYGLLRDLNTLTASWGGQRRIGLYANDLTPDRHTAINDIVPCTFAGYDGTHDLLGWSAAALLGDRAVTYATPRLWTYTGGYPSGWVVGYYVVDVSVQLCWAERLPGGPQLMAVAGDEVRLTPSYSLGSRFP